MRRGRGSVESKQSAAERISVGICADFRRPSYIIMLVSAKAKGMVGIDKDSYILDQCEEKNRKPSQVSRELQASAAHTSTSKLLSVGGQKLHGLGLQGFTGGFQATSESPFNSLVAEVSSDRLLVRRCVDICKALGGGKSQSQDANSPLTIACSMKYSGLHTNNRFCNRLVNGDFNNVGLVAGESRERAEVGTAIEKVTVKCAHAQTGRSTDTEDGLQADLRREVFRELPCELDRILSPCSVPSRIEVRLTASISRQVAERRHILVLRREEEHIYRDLGLRTLHSKALVEAVCGLQKTAFLAGAQNLLVLSHSQGAMSNVGKRGAKNGHLASNRGDQLVTSTQCRSHSTAIVLGVLEHFLQFIQERFNVFTAFAQSY